MDSRLENKADFNSTNFLVFLVKWKKQLAIVLFTAAVLSSIISFLIKPKYKATVVLFPSTTSSVSKALLGDNRGDKQDILMFGEEVESEQLMQILYSDEIKNAIIKKYNLIEHYNIPTDDKYKMTHLYEKFEKNITYKRTEFMSIKIEVIDTDPQVAADIANDISALSDTVRNSIQRQRAIKGLKLVEEKYMSLYNEIAADEDSLNKLRALGVNDYESQAERLNEAYAKAVLEGKQGAIKEFDKEREVLAKYGGAYVSLRDNLEFKRKSLSYLKTKYEEAKMDAYQDMPHKFVVNSAFKAEKKSYPIRWLIVVVSVMASFLAAIIVLMILENYDRYKLKLNNIHARDIIS
jgi:uncharacterized protein involved in exopolysaccharide biosynthesis